MSHFVFSYSAKVPTVRHKKAPWWLRWWKKTLPYEDTEWRRYMFSCDEPDANAAVEKYGQFVPFELVRNVQLVETAHRSAFQSIDCIEIEK